MDYSLLIGEVLALSDNTKIQNVPWSVLKKHVMEPNPSIKKLLSAEELQLLERLRKAQIDQRAGVDAPLFAPAKVDDLLCLLKAKVRRNETWYNGIYFTDDGRAFVVGVIDSLTDWNLKKQAEKKIKGLIN